MTTALTPSPPLTHRKWPPAAARGPPSLSAPSVGIAPTARPHLFARKPERCLTDPSETAPPQPHRLSEQQSETFISTGAQSLYCTGT